MEASISDLTKKVWTKPFNLDSPAQYIRSENIKIHGIQYEQGEEEDTSEMVKMYSNTVWFLSLTVTFQLVIDWEG